MPCWTVDLVKMDNWCWSFIVHVVVWVVNCTHCVDGAYGSCFLGGCGGDLV